MSEKRIPMLPNQSHLQIELTPEAYQALWPIEQDAGQSLGKLFLMPEHPYWQSLPRYLIARCPFCGCEYEDILDTYTLHFWSTAQNGHTVFWKTASQSTRCEHFVRVQHFVNLNHTDPYEVRHLWHCDEVPTVMPYLLADDIESYAVMHALPICRIEQEQFVPRYTLYMITYYSAAENVERLMERARTHSNWNLVRRPPNTPSALPLWWDLNHWVHAGRLHWLTPDHPLLPLQKGPPETFPYGNIPEPSNPLTMYSHRDKFSYSYAQNE